MFGEPMDDEEYERLFPDPEKEKQGLKNSKEEHKRDRIWFWIVVAFVVLLVILGLLGEGPLGKEQSQQTQECTKFNEIGC